MTPLPADKALDQFFIEARCRLLDLAAILDRVDRGGGVSDPRLVRIAKALDAVAESGPGRAEAVQRIFSLDYDAGWPKPVPQ